MMWSTRRRAFIRLIAMSAAVVGCARAGAGSFWQKGRVYDLTMRVTARSATLQAKRDSGKLKDTVIASLHVDSVVGDSVFGTYSADWRLLGTWIGAVPSSPQEFAGRVRGSTFEMRLGSNVTDAGAGFQGSHDGSQAHGTWGVDGGWASGEFQVTAKR